MEHRHTILIIEDDLNLLEGLEIFLSMEGYDILTARNGLEGIRLARRRRPDIILSNFRMPGADGLEVLRAVRRDARMARTPLIFMTADHSVSIREDSLKEGADGYVRKPFQTEDLMRIIRKLLGKSQTADQR